MMNSKKVPHRSPYMKVIRLDVDGGEHPDFLSLREYVRLTSVIIVSDPAPRPLRYGHRHGGVPLNGPATQLIQAAEKGERSRSESLALEVRGPAYLGGQFCWFHNLPAKGNPEGVTARIDHLTFRGVVGVHELGIAFNGNTWATWSYVSAENKDVDLVALRIALSG